MVIKSPFPIWECPIESITGIWLANIPSFHTNLTKVPPDHNLQLVLNGQYRLRINSQEYHVMPGSMIYYYTAQEQHRARHQRIKRPQKINPHDDLPTEREPSHCRRSVDLLLVDFGLRHGSIKEEAAASLARAKPHLSFLTKPLSRVYGEDNISIESKITHRCPIPNSYALEIYATVKDRRFMVASWRRYDAKSLFDAFSLIGWHHVGSWTYDEEKPNCLALFKRG